VTLTETTAEVPSARPHNVVMEDLFTDLRTGAGAASALAGGDVPDRGGVPVFRCSVAQAGRAAIANPAQARGTVNFYELLPTVLGAAFEPGTPLAPGMWTVEWTCPAYPAARGGAAAGAFHVGVGVAAADLPPAWGRNAAGPVDGVPGNVVVPVLEGRRLVRALRALASGRAAAERAACEAMRGFVVAKAARVRNADPTVFDRDDAVQEGLARLVVVMRRFAARGRPRACWSVAAGLVLERDLPRAADRVSPVPTDVAHCAHWLTHTDLVEPADPGLTPAAASAAYAADQRARRRRAPGTRTWLSTRSAAAGDATADRPAFAPEVWRAALAEARRGAPVSLDRAPDGRPAGDLVPSIDRDVELVGERRLVDLVDDLLVGTGLTYEDLRDHLYPRLARRDYGEHTLRPTAPPPAGPDGSRRLATAAENRLLALVARPGESLTRDRAALRRRVREVMFDEAGRFRPTEDRRQRWAAHRGLG